MSVPITYCPLGYAYGYSPINGSRQWRELNDNIADVGEAIGILAVARNRKGPRDVAAVETFISQVARYRDKMGQKA